MKKIFLIALCYFNLIAIAQTTLAKNQEWLVTSSLIKFKIKNAGFTVDGNFTGLNAKIIFDTSKGFGNSIDATIDSKTINTNNSSRDGHLKKVEYFSVDKFPTINLKAILFSKEKDGSFRGFFKLTIKDKTKDVLIPFVFSEKDGKVFIKGTFIINRLDYGVGSSSMILSDNVVITIEVNAIKK